MNDLTKIASSSINILSDAEKLGITGIVLMMFIFALIFAVLMYREERKCRTVMYEEVKKCRDEITALLKSDISHARNRS